MIKKGTVILCLACIVLLAVRLGAEWYKGYEFSRDCKAYLKRAADASTVEIAVGELNKAINYAEGMGLTKGNSSTFFYSPVNDVDFWYENLVAARQELLDLDSDAPSLEKTNALMKLRESITDDSGDGVVVTVPANLPVYPNQTLYAVWLWSTLIIGIVSGCVVYVVYVRVRT